MQVLNQNSVASYAAIVFLCVLRSCVNCPGYTVAIVQSETLFMLVIFLRSVIGVQDKCEKRTP